MTMAAKMRVGWVLAAVCGSMAAAALPLSAEEQAGDLRADFQAIVARRDALAAALSARIQADGARGAAQDFELRLGGGADRDDLDVVLRRRGGQWRAAYGQCLAWCQATMQEWRGFHLGNGVISNNWRAYFRFPADCEGLTFDGDRLAGRLAVRFKLDALLDEKHPPGSPPSWWDRFIPVPYHLPRTQMFVVTAAVPKDAWFIDLVLAGGVNWQDKRKGDGAGTVVRRPVVVRFELPGTRFSFLHAQTPTWNGGFHEGDAAGLALAGGRLTGTLVIYLHQDGWVPWGGKTYQHAPQVVRFQIDARLRHNVLGGTYEADGDMGRFRGRAFGRGGRAVIGRFQADGDMGEQVGPIRGMLLDDAAPVQEAVTSEPAAPADPAAAARHVASRINTVLHQVRALHLAVQHYPLPLDQAMAQTDVAEPAWQDADAAAAAHLTAYCRLARRMLSAVGSPQEVELPPARPEDSGDSPGAGAVAAGVGDEQVNVLPDGAAGWVYLSRWEVLGPFEQRLGLAHDGAAAPEIIPVPGLKYVQRADHLGAAKAAPVAQSWQQRTCETARLTPPWAKPPFYVRFTGQVWYGLARADCRQVRRAFLSLESGDHAKLWLNGRLVWTAAEKHFRYRSRGRVIVPVSLQAGVNEFLVRVHRDRRPSWLELAIATNPPAQGEAAEAAPAADRPDTHVYPEAVPPLAWDIDRSVNVAWRDAALGGRARPAVTGDLVLAAARPHTLHCLDAATGKVRWTGRYNVLELLDPKAMEAWNAAGDDPDKRFQALKAYAGDLGRRVASLQDVPVAEPLTDGRSVWVHAGTGAAARFDLSGKRLWMQRTHLTEARLHRHGDAIIVEGAPGTGWPRPAAEAQPKGGKRGREPAMVGILVLDAASGEVRRRLTVAGSFQAEFSRLIVLGSGRSRVAILHASNGALVDLKRGCVLPAIDVDYPAGGSRFRGTAGYPAGTGYCLTGSGERLYFTSQDQNAAVRLWLTPAGLPAWGRLWESNYEHGGFGLVGATSTATGRYLFTWMPVLDRGPHCPDPRLELHVQEARTGRPLAKLKPALENAVVHHVTPVVAGGYVFAADSGGGTHGGSQTHGQMVVATADENLLPVCRNLVDLGTRAAPVFAGGRMLLRSPKALTCIAVTTPRGRDYQSRRVAETVLAELAPVAAVAVGDVAPMDPSAMPPNAPVGELVDGRPTQYWLGAGPFPGAPAPGDDAALAALRVGAGGEVSYAGRRMASSPLGRTHAYNDPPLFKRQHSLQGTGDIVPFFATWVDPRCCSSPQAAGLLFTILDNRRDRVVVPMLKAEGVTGWLAGRRLAPDQPLHLKPGLYPFLVRVAPAFYASAGKPVRPDGKAPDGGPDYRLAPAFRELPNPATRRRLRLERITARADHLRAIVKDLPGSEHAKAAAALLAEIAK